VDYSDKAALVNALEGVDTVLSFIITFNDPNNQSQINLIDACIEAGVRRFAPSEWATRSHCGMPAYEGKDQVYDYLREINKEKKVRCSKLVICNADLEIGFGVHFVSVWIVLELFQLPTSFGEIHANFSNADRC